jgi:ribosomal protein L37AE/L43A
MCWFEEDSALRNAELPMMFCPSCNSDQVKLDGIELGNQWRCERCGKAWAEIVWDPEMES